LARILQEVDETLKEYAPSLRAPEGIDPLRLLRALCLVETSGGINNLPKHEPAYDAGGRWFQKSARLQEDYARYGRAVACSWGPMQIMYNTARELGYEGPPWYLADPDAGVRVAVEYLNRRVFPQAQNLRDIADAYNSGSCRDSIVPGQYIEAICDAYEALEKGMP
jgi:hypothetical protein